jgi:hypothetical protein
MGQVMDARSMIGDAGAASEDRRKGKDAYRGVSLWLDEGIFGGSGGIEGEFSCHEMDVVLSFRQPLYPSLEHCIPPQLPDKG